MAHTGLGNCGKGKQAVIIARRRATLSGALPSPTACSSFAVELGKAFFSSEAAKQQDTDSSGSTAAAAAGGGEPLPIQPGNMIWLIQRDFLQVWAWWQLP